MNVFHIVKYIYTKIEIKKIVAVLDWIGIKKWKKMKSEPISAVIPITDLTQFELLEKQKEIEETMQVFEKDDPEYSDFKEQLSLIQEYIK